MKHIFRLLACTAALLTLTATATSGQRIDSPYRFIDTRQFVGVYGGQLNAEEGRLGAGPQPAPVLGAHWAIRLTNAFALGAEIGFSPSTRTVRDTTFVEADSVFTPIGEADITLLLAMASLRMNLTGARTWNNLQPFVQFGGGLSIDISGSSAVEADLPANVRFDHGTSFAGQFGAGVEWFPSSRVAVRLDARNLMWKLSVPEAFLFTDAGRTLSRSEWEQNFFAAVGLSFHF
jgi:hypothetical protein